MKRKKSKYEIAVRTFILVVGLLGLIGGGLMLAYGIVCLVKDTGANEANMALDIVGLIGCFLLILFSLTLTALSFSHYYYYNFSFLIPKWLFKMMDQKKEDEKDGGKNHE